MRTGVGVPETHDLKASLKSAREPLLAAVRLSSDFDAAYEPLLAMANRLYPIDPPAARSLLQDLAAASPGRAEARLLLNHLSVR